MQDQWIVVADAARARIFAAIGPDSELRELHDLVHPESRRHTGDLRTGGKGEAIESIGRNTRQTNRETTTGEKHADTFAAEVAEFLRQRRVDNDYQRLVLIAEPGMLGRLRHKLDDATARLVDETVDKNLTQHERSEIQKVLGASG